MTIAHYQRTECLVCTLDPFEENPALEAHT